jgi:hypothetical protein
MGKCPGQDTRFWTSDDISSAPCPNCGKLLEFWKTEPRRRCFGCGKNVLNPKLDLGCAKSCAHAADCLGLTPTTGSKDNSLADSLIEEMKKVFGDDRKRISHALEVLDNAERMLLVEEADPLVVKASAILHDIGIHEAERKHGSNAGRYQEIEGPPIARAILERSHIDSARVEHICRIVGSHHSAADIDTPEFRILWDADRLANVPEECAGKDRAAQERHVRQAFRTGTGRFLAAYRLLGEGAAGSSGDARG